jgi:mediator of RNA polymerase II transcription subunit 31
MDAPPPPPPAAAAPRLASTTSTTSSTTHTHANQYQYTLPDDETRFALELEFIQCLANADYLHWLALNKYLEDPAFLAFLRYLKYWRQPEYARFILYPQSLAMLELLEKPEVRREVARGPYKDFLHEQQLLQWRYYLNNRRKFLSAAGPAGGDWESVLHAVPSAVKEEGEEAAGDGNKKK